MCQQHTYNPNMINAHIHLLEDAFPCEDCVVYRTAYTILKPWYLNCWIKRKTKRLNSKRQQPVLQQLERACGNGNISMTVIVVRNLRTATSKRKISVYSAKPIILTGYEPEEPITGKTTASSRQHTDHNDQDKKNHLRAQNGHANRAHAIHKVVKLYHIHQSDLILTYSWLRSDSLWSYLSQSHPSRIILQSSAVTLNSEADHHEQRPWPWAANSGD